MVYYFVDDELSQLVWLTTLLLDFVHDEQTSVKESVRAVLQAARFASLQVRLANKIRNWEKLHAYLENLPPILPVMHLRSGQSSYIILRACHFCSLLPAYREVSLAIEPMCERTLLTCIRQFLNRLLHLESALPSSKHQSSTVRSSYRQFPHSCWANSASSCYESVSSIFSVRYALMTHPCGGIELGSRCC